MKRNSLIECILIITGAAAASVGCGHDEDTKKTCTLSDPVQSCSSGQVCETAAGQPTCVAPVLVRGLVRTAAGAPIAGALVAALDANDAPATGTATSGPDGAYELRVPVDRDAGGAPLLRPIKLHAAAEGYETFPGGLR